MGRQPITKWLSKYPAVTCLDWSWTDGELPVIDSCPTFHMTSWISGTMSFLERIAYEINKQINKQTNKQKKPIFLRNLVLNILKNIR